VFTNNCGNLNYPLLFGAIVISERVTLRHYDPMVLKSGLCTRA
jgi:hypothetical protein